jgi:hypothetical protein
MAREIRIYKDAAAGLVFFEGSTVNPLPCNIGSVVVAPGEPTRMKITRSDKFIAGTTNPRVLFKRLNWARVRDFDNNAFATFQEAFDYVESQLAQAAAEDVAASYKGTWDASSATLSPTGSTNANGDWYFVAASGNIDPNSETSATGSVTYLTNDIVKYVSGSVFTGWQRIPNETLRVDQLDSRLNNSALDQYDKHVHANYTGSVRVGSPLQPYTDIQDAIDDAADGATIFVDGDFTITSPLTLDPAKSISIVGGDGTSVGYASFANTNNNVFQQTAAGSLKRYRIDNIEIKNGSYGIIFASALSVKITNCKIHNCGWSGTGLSLVNAEAGSTLGFDSSTTDLANYAASANVISDAAAIRLTGVPSTEFTDNEVYNNAGGIEYVDCGIGGKGIVSRNQIYYNLNDGIALDSTSEDATTGCENFVVYNNSVTFNGSDGIRVEGGLDNTLSLGLVKGNWNSGVELEHCSNIRVRELDLDNNNRSAVSAAGGTADGLASLQFSGNTQRDGSTFIGEVLDVTIHNTNLGANTVRCGLFIGSEVAENGNNDSIIRIDNCGFLGQDYALDIAADLDDLMLVVGSCEYVGTAIKAVRIQNGGNYHALPFSNFVTSVPYLDVSKDTVSKTIALKNGQNGETINTYGVNEIRSITRGSTIDIVLVNSSKIQLSGLTETRVYIDGDLQTGTLQDVNNALNAYFTDTAGAAPTPITTLVVNEEGIDTTLITSSVVIDPVGDSAYGSSTPVGSNHATIYSTIPITKAGEHYTFQINQEGSIGMGFHKSGSTGDFAYSQIGSQGGGQRAGLYWSTWFGSTSDGPESNAGEASSNTAQLSGWYSFASSSVGINWLAGANVLMKAGIDTQGFLGLSYYNPTTEQYVKISRTAAAVTENDKFHLVIKLADANVRVYDTPKVHLAPFQEEITVQGDSDVLLLGTGTGSLASGVTAGTISGFNDGFYSSASLSASGEYFQIDTDAGWDGTFGLVHGPDFTTTTGLTDLSDFDNADRSKGYGQFFMVDVPTGSVYAGTEVSQSGSYSSSLGVIYTPSVNNTYNSVRIGFNLLGQPYYAVAADAAKTTYTEILVLEQAAPTGSYQLLSIFESTGPTVAGLTKGIQTGVPILTYYTLESPDGVWHYPLFETEAEANYFDANLAQPSTGSGTSHTHVYVDDTTGTTWYMPDNGGAMDSSTHPTASTYLSGTSWNYVATFNDQLYAPAAFSQAVSLDEGATLNLQLTPADATFTTTVANLPSWTSFSNDYIQGTAPNVPATINYQASASYTASVTRTNSYGSNTGTLTINVNNTTQDIVPSGYIVHQGYFSANAYSDSVATIHNEGQSVAEISGGLDQGNKLVWQARSFSQFGILTDSGSAVTGSDDLGGYLNDASTRATYWALGTQLSSADINNAGRGVGWDTNTEISPTSNLGNDILVLQYDVDGYIRLYIVDDGAVNSSATASLVLTSADTYTGNQQIFFTTADDYNVDISLPAYTKQAVAYTGNPISGYTHDNTSAALVDADTLGSGSAVTLDTALKSGQRLVIDNSWIATNILSSMDILGTTSEALEYGIGILSSSATAPYTGTDLVAGNTWTPDSSSNSNYKKRAFTDGTERVNTGIGFAQGGSSTVRDGFIEKDGTDVYVVWRNSATQNESLTTTPRTDSGWTNTYSAANITGDQTIALFTNGREGDIASLDIIDAPLPLNHFKVTENPEGTFLFASGAVHGVTPTATFPTLQAGTTYTFHVQDSSIESADILKFTLDGIAEYTGSITRTGTPGTEGARFTFAVPGDQQFPLYWYNDSVGISTGSAVTLVGSTYVAGVTGITLEGPSANQTGTNIANNGDYGWASITESLSAGERFVMDNDFFTDLLAEMGDQYEIRIGLKGDNWDNGDQSTKSNSTITGEVFKGDLQLRVYQSSASNIYLQIFHSGIGGSNQMLVNTVALHNTTCAFLEITSTGNNIRMGFGRNGQYGVTAGSEATTAFADWASYKGQTGNQGFGITSLDVMFLVTDIFNGNNDDYDGANVDWTHLSEVSVPAPAPTNATDWNKALDFSGGNEHGKQVSNNTDHMPIRQAVGTTIPAPSSAGQTVSNSSGRPWAISCVFRIDGNSSNQHIWNQGEGAGSADDNIYLRVDSNRRSYFGWGRIGALNEIFLGTLTANQWYGVYIGFTGERLSGNTANTANLAECFDIRIVTLSTATVGSNLSTSVQWGHVLSTTGGRMDRTVLGDFTIGGRGGNRNFHGKVAAVVTTTLKRSDSMPSTAEIGKMVTDPVGWLTDYKVGETYRQPSSANNTSNFALNNANSANSTQVWLMGDGTADSFSNGIRNYVLTTDQNNTKMQLNSMTSNDIETVTITGLT